jgi:hypothetical protein
MITNSLKNFDQKINDTYDKIDYDTFIKYCEAYLNNHYTIIALGDKVPSLKFNKEDLEFLNHELDINVLSLTPHAYNKYNTLIKDLIRDINASHNKLKFGEFENFKQRWKIILNDIYDSAKNNNRKPRNISGIKFILLFSFRILFTMLIFLISLGIL